MKIKDLFTDKSKWARHAYARDKHGDVCIDHPERIEAKWCLAGSIYHCYTDEAEQLKIFKIVRKKIGDIAKWNDAPGRTFDEVKNLVNELAI